MQIIHVNSAQNIKPSATAHSNLQCTFFSPAFKTRILTCCDLLLRENLPLCPLIYTCRIGSPYEGVGFQDRSDVQTFDDTMPIIIGVSHWQPVLARSAREYAASDILLSTNRNSQT
ncbi:hypothetical protein AVEN_260110-1 [Araneus ventricosus]|uniref:Uncharacterized protein n=1 Tax=Araneus ventricosus TaxID=182803 RepID=A0A4Y2MBC2_ARAVE|nr:hypothetical protein AVEN_260110-1 [Araneus ventricosus]